MDSSDYMKLAVYKELQEALQLKRINEELLEYLGASLRWLFHYSKKYKIPLPENKKIDLVIDRTLEIANKIPNNLSTQKSTPILNTQRKNRTQFFIYLI
jgi:hypothetical protein